MVNIKAMAETLKQMEAMQNSVIKEISVDIEDKRENAIKKIFKYFDDISESLDGITRVKVDIPVNIIWTVNNDNKIVFNAERPLRDHKRGDMIGWYFCKTNGHYYKDDYVYDYFDRYTTIRNNDGCVRKEFVDLINNWDLIKKTIECGVEKELTRRMDAARERTRKTICSYETANNFEA